MSAVAMTVTAPDFRQVATRCIPVNSIGKIDMIDIISGVDDADRLRLGRIGEIKTCELIGLDLLDSVGSFLSKPTMLTGGFLVIPTTEVRECVDLGINLNCLDVWVVGKSIPVATEGLEGRDLEPGRDVLDLSVLCEVF